MLTLAPALISAFNVPTWPFCAAIYTGVASFCIQVHVRQQQHIHSVLCTSNHGNTAGQTVNVQCKQQ